MRGASIQQHFNHLYKAWPTTLTQWTVGSANYPESILTRPRQSPYLIHVIILPFFPINLRAPQYYRKPAREVDALELIPAALYDYAVSFRAW